jgi:hypothetical protein
VLAVFANSVRRAKWTADPPNLGISFRQSSFPELRSNAQMAPSENTEAYTISLVTRGLGRLFCGGSIACLVFGSLVFPKRKVVEFVKRRLFFLRLSHNLEYHTIPIRASGTSALWDPMAYGTPTLDGRFHIVICCNT